MNPRLRQSLSAVVVIGLVGLGLAGALSAALALREARDDAARLQSQLDALKARAARAGGPPRDPAAAPYFEARAITLAGAAVQERVAAAVAAANGRLASSNVDLEQRGADRKIALAAELSIAQPDLQKLIYDLETGRPYLFVDALEARIPEAGPGGAELRVSLQVSGAWKETK